MRKPWIVIGILAVTTGVCKTSAEPPETPGQLVREVVYNELHDHESHGYWRYWVQSNSSLKEQVETSGGPITRLLFSNGRPLDADGARAERARLKRLVASPSEQESHRQAYADDEKRIGRIVALLPDAFSYEYAGEEDGNYRLRFHPNPAYVSHSIEARIFHCMSGELWVNARFKRLARLDGRLDENVDFGFGLLGRLYQGGWFKLQRIQVSPTDWKTERLEVHMSGRAMFFKTIARETCEVRGGFTAIPPAISFAQGVSLLEQQDAGRIPPPGTKLGVTPNSVAFATSR